MKENAKIELVSTAWRSFATICSAPCCFFVEESFPALRPSGFSRNDWISFPGGVSRVEFNG